MAKGFTYFCTDHFGNVYNRYSAGHGYARYTHARIIRVAGSTEPVGKTDISYASTRSGAYGRMADVTNYNDYCHRAGKDYRYEGEIVEVRAYEGRHTAEPVAA